MTPGSLIVASAAESADVAEHARRQRKGPALPCGLLAAAGLVGSGVGLDGHTQPTPTQLRAEVLGPLERSGGYHTGAAGVDLPGVRARLRPRHRRNDPAERLLDVLEAVTLAIQHHDLVRPQLADAAQRLLVEIDVNSRHRWCGRHGSSIASPRQS